MGAAPTQTAAAAAEIPVRSANGVLPKGLRRKLMLRLVAPIGAITFVNSIDRVNISYAAHAMGGDIGLSPERFGVGVSMFFVAYLLFQYPHSALLRRLGVKRWLLGGMVLWGVAGLWMAWVRTPVEFYGARFLLGAAEAGLGPGMTWYISRWTPASFRATALAGALAAVPLSMVLGGPLCGWLLGIGNPLGLAPWRWMFLVLALATLALAGLAALYFVDGPSEASWLDAGERATLAQTIAQDRSEQPSRSPLLAALRSGWLWRCCLIWLLVMTGSYALVFWLPQLVRQIAAHQSEFAIGSMSALPQIGLVLGLILNGRHSDATGERLWHVGLPAVAGGLAMLAAAMLPTGGPVLLLLVVAGAGIGAVQGVFWSVPASVRIGGDSVPMGAIALISMFGTAGGIVGPLLTGAIVARSGSFAPAIAVLAALLILSAAALVTRLPWRRA